jgi:riboflavin kinase/FMN adenylyltransferase
MLVSSKQIKGKGRGHTIGFPTINLIVPEDFPIEEGIYASWITIDGIKYKGALHYGSIPTFDQPERTLEVYLLDIDDATVPETEGKEIGIDIAEKIRDVKKFDTADDLSLQIARDVDDVKSILE